MTLKKKLNKVRDNADALVYSLMQRMMQLPEIYQRFYAAALDLRSLTDVQQKIVKRTLASAAGSSCWTKALFGVLLHSDGYDLLEAVVDFAHQGKALVGPMRDDIWNTECWLVRDASKKDDIAYWVVMCSQDCMIEKPMPSAVEMLQQRIGSVREVHAIECHAARLPDMEALVKLLELLADASNWTDGEIDCAAVDIAFFPDILPGHEK